MNRTSWVIGLALLFALLAGCSAPSGPSNVTVQPTVVPTTGGGISDITTGMAPRTTTLSDALRDLASNDALQMFNVSEMKIHQLNGIGVNDKGEAQMWVLGAYNGISTTLLIHTEGEWRMVEWQGTLPSQEINLSAVVDPDVLYSSQSQVIGQAMTRHRTDVSNLELVGTTYTITFTSSGSITVLTFNAITGELLSST